jgi:hypothetical protein
MKILDRFTRDRHSRVIWGGATAVFLVLALLALAGGRSALSDQEQHSEDLAVQYTDTVLFEALDADLLGGEIRGRQYRDLIIQVQGGIMTDEGVARVRIWAPDGTLLFSTESLEQVGVAKAVNSAEIEAAVKGKVSSVVSEDTVEAKSGLSGTTQRLFQTFAPIRVRERTAILGVAEVDRTYASISAAAAQPWRTLQIGLAAATLLCALLLLVSLRRSTSALDSVGISAPRTDVPVEPLADDRNPLRLRNELEREREANRRLQAELEATAAVGGPGVAPPPPPADQPEAAAPAAEVPAAPVSQDAIRLAEAEAALSEAGSHTAELERELAEAKARAVAPETLATLEERVMAAEARAREAELRMQALAAAPPPEPPPTYAPAPASSPAPSPAYGPGDEAADEEPEVPEPSPQAMDLRSRLARTAARKKLGSHEPDDPNA